MAHIAGDHHATLSVGGAQADVDSHTGTLGLRFIERTVRYDGSLPKHHLCRSTANGDEARQAASARTSRSTSSAQPQDSVIPAPPWP